MVVVKIGDDHVVDVIGSQTERPDGLHRMAQDRPAALFGLVGVIAGINENRPAFRFQHPDEVIHRMRLLVRRIEHETLELGLVVPVGIFDSVDFSQCFRHGAFRCSLVPLVIEAQTNS